MRIGQINNLSFYGVKKKTTNRKKASAANINRNTKSVTERKKLIEAEKIRKAQEIAEWHTAQRDLIEDTGSLWD